MTRYYLLPLLGLSLLAAGASAQTKLGNNAATPSSAAILELEDTTKGILIPRMSTANRLAIANAPRGLLVYDSTQKGFYFYRTTGWTAIPITTSITGTALQDADANTRVEVEKFTNEDKIRFTLAGTERWRMTAGRLENISSTGTLAIGINAGLNDAGQKYNTYYGENAGMTNVSGTYNTGLGIAALQNNTGVSNTAIGNKALLYNTTGSGNIAIGSLTAGLNKIGNGNIAIGNAALYSDTAGTGNVAIGDGAGYYETGSGKLYIANSTTTAPLLYGDFSNKSLLVNDSLQSRYLTLTEGAAAGYVLQSDAFGHAGWVSSAALGDTASLIADADRNTRIRTEANANEDKIRYDLGGTERWVMSGLRLEPKNTGSSTYVGEGAGTNDDGSTRKNVGIGYNALLASVSGTGNVGVGYAALSSSTASSNTAVGYYAAANNTTGAWNTALGQAALQGNLTGAYNLAIGGQALANHTSGDYNIGIGMSSLHGNQGGAGNVAVGYNAGVANITGSGNIFLGYQAGYNETGSNKLYIENTNSSTPLIYGDFSTDSLRINGSMAVTGNGGFVATGTSGTGNIPATGSGVRMMWYPKKAAFRAGQAVSNYWDEGNTGSNSFATGSGTRATGNGSVATGSSSIASGSNALALGEGVTAPAAYETAIGAYNTSYSPTGAATDHVLSVGNGAFGAPSNALTVLRSGNTGINTDAPGAPLSVITTATAGTGGLVAQFGSGSLQGRILLYDETLATTLGPKISFAASNVAQIAGSGPIAVMPSGNFGVNTTTPASTLTVNGSIGVKRTAVSSAYTASASDYLIGVTVTSAVTINLPTAGVAGIGRSYIIKAETTGTPNITLDGSGSETIDGAATKSITSAYGVLRIYSDGANWWTF